MAADLAWLDAIALRDLVADGQVTPAELAEGAIARIDAANPVLNAVVVPRCPTPAGRSPPTWRCRAARSTASRSCSRNVGACLAGLPLYMGNGCCAALD